ncbi:MAG: Pre-rRNA-processing protein ipi3 [Thelocarpon impressellum]|nr:MAG: Pre-rRNA-processing protein ipi3 [Thelocarpon impressellum]
MLTELCITSTLVAGKAADNSSLKDASIQIHQIQPAHAVQSTFKKSSTRPNCLAVSATHVFAAQADKAVVHVYTREKGSQEATVPFPEKIYSVVFTGDEGGVGVLVLGTEEGRLILWEVSTGRQISTPQSHLQAVTALAISRDSSYLLSGSLDSNLLVWSLPALLSFSSSPSDDTPGTSPLHTLSNHRAAISAIRTGHSSSGADIAVSASDDSSCIVWNYRTGELLRTYLLQSVPTSLAVDPCDRAVYAGLRDGGVQLIDFFDPSTPANPLHDQTFTLIQPPSSSAWTAGASQSLGATLCVALVYEGNYLLSGHASGKLVLWDIGSRKFSRQLTSVDDGITNLLMLAPTGFPGATQPTLKLHQVTKPRYDASLSSSSDGAGIVPAAYSLHAQFSSALPTTTSHSLFTQALTHPSLPAALLTFSPLHPCSSTTSSPYPATTKPAEASPLLKNLINTRLETARLRSRAKELAAQEARLRRREARFKAKQRTQRGSESDVNEDSSAVSRDGKSDSDSESKSGGGKVDGEVMET